MGLFNFKREIKWDKDVMKVTDSMSNIWDSVIHEMSDKIKDEQTEEVLRHFNIDMSELREFVQFKREGKSLPTYIAEWQWIKVEDGNPKDDELYYITILDESGDLPRLYTDVGWYCEEAKGWVVEGRMQNDVIAWMPRPEPYEPPKE